MDKSEKTGKILPESLFGTDGIRARVGQYPLTQEMLPKIGYAIGSWAKTLTSGQKTKILIAQDTRLSCDWLKSAFNSGLLLHDIELFDAGILPTPGLYHIIKHHQDVSLGIIISASHNPYYDNGIKIIEGKFGKISHETERSITAAFKNLPEMKYAQFGTNHIASDAAEIYVNAVTRFFNPRLFSGLKIVLDTSNGSTYEVAPEIFERLGAKVITINNKPNGININENCGTLHPESLQKEVLKQKAIAGFAFDGDGDRVIAVNRFGEVKTGDDILAILSRHPDYANCRAIVGTVMSNQGLETFLNETGKQLIRTDVGDKFVAQALAENNLTLGGEQSGHIILRDLINTGDGILVALKVLETIRLTEDLDMTSFDKFPQVLVNIKIKNKLDLDKSPIKDMIDAQKAKLKAGRILVRYSGTESLLRIMVESQSANEGKETADRLAQELGKYLN